MSASILSACKLPVRAFRASLSLAAVIGLCGMSVEAQNLRFAPVIYNVQSVNGAQATTMNGPNGVAVDGLGNLYILDGGHGQVRKVDPTGTAIVYAGTGGSGLFGNNGPAIKATLYSPSAIAADTAGNLFIADTYNFAVRRIDAATGIITIIAGGNGSGTSVSNGPASAAQFSFLSGIAVDTAGNVYVSDASTLVVRRIDPSGTITTIAGGGTPVSGNGDSGLGTAASLNAPYGLAVDGANHLYIADNGASVVRVVDLTNDIISTFAGTGVRAITGDGSLATAAQLNSPRGVATDGQGNVYIADGVGYVRQVNSSKIISTLAGSSGGGSFIGDGTLPTQGLFSSIYAVAADANGNVYFPTSSTNKVYQIVTHPERFPMTKIGATSPPQRLIIQNTGNTDITYTSLTTSGDFAFSSSSNAYLSNNSTCSRTVGNHTISSGFSNYCQMDVTFTPTAAGIRSFPLTMVSNDNPTTFTQNLTSTGLGSALASTGGLIYTIGGQFHLTGVYGDGGQATASSIVGPDGLVTDSAGNVYFTEYGYCRVRKIDASTGILTTVAGINYANCGLNAAYNQPDGPAATAKLYLPSAIAMDTSGNLYVSDAGHDQIREITTGGQIVRIVGTGAGGCNFGGDGGLAIDAQICSPTGIAVNKAGDIFFADGGAHLIRKVTASTGKISIIAGMYPGSGSFTYGYSADGVGTAMLLNEPWGVALDSTEANLYFAEFGNHIVRKLNLTTGMVTTVAGKHGTTGYTGDGYPSTSSTLYSPHGVAIDAANNVYIADSQNNLVRRIDGSTGIITTVAGNYFVNDLYNGEGIPATAAGLDYPENVTVDSMGYLILSERSPLIRQVSPNGMLSFGNQLIDTTSATQTVTISNIGNTPMTFSSPAYDVSGDFAYASGGTCTFTGPLAVGESCTVKVNFTPKAVGVRYGLLAYYDDGVASPQLTQLSGTGTAPAQPVAQTISLTNPGTMTYGASVFSPVATSTSGLPVTITVQSGPASISAGVLTITGAGNVILAANQAGNASYLAAPQVTTNFTVNKATLTVTPATVNIDYGAAIPASFATNITGYVNSDPVSVVTGSAAVTTTATSSSPVGPYTLTATAGTLAATNYTFTFATGILNINIASQQLTINPIGNKTYGNASFAVTSGSTSGLPVTLMIQSGNATVSNGTITLTGVGPVVVQADQAGDANYSPATSVTQSFTVAKAVLTVTPVTVNIDYGTTVPTSFATGITGYVYNESSSVISGTPSVTTTATSGSPVGPYTLTASTGTLTATNYSFTFAAGTLNINKLAQQLTINPVGNKAYGNAAFAVTASATSSLPVTLTVQSGPATITGGVLAITGAGTVVLAADQAGNATYLPATQVTTNFSVSKATLTVTPATVSIGYGSAIPGSFATNITGYVYNDSGSAITGSAAVTTTATSSSPVGPYVLTATAGTLGAPNYSFTFAPGTLNITIGTQQLTINPIGNKTYGDAAFAVTATSSASLPVTLTIKSGNATINNGTVTLTGIGVVVVQADQAGNANYSPATAVTQNFTVARAALTVTAANASMVYGAASLPSFSGTITGYVNGEGSSVVSGAATYSTSASSTSVPNTYQITPNISGLSATNYTFAAVAGTLTVSPAPLTVTPNAATRSYGAANPSLTGTATGLKNGDNPSITYSTTALLASAPGTYPITAAVTGTGSANYTTTLTPVNLTVTKANTLTTITVTQVLDVQNVDTLTATVVPIIASGTPTGTVTFYENNGATTVGVGTYIAGTGYVLTTSNFTGGVHNITATYSGDTNFFGSTTANASTSTVGDYTFTASPPTLTITAGGTGTTTITFTPTFGWTGTQTPTCTGLHTGMHCSFSPATLGSTGNNTVSTTTLTITTTGAHALQGVMSSSLGAGPLSLLALLVLLPVAYASRRRRGIYRLTLLLLITVAMLLPMGCGSSGPAVNPDATPLGADPVVVSFAGADSVHQLNLTITVN